MGEGILSLRWKNHPTTFIHSLGILLQKETFSDVTLACDGHFFHVHKLVLSVCSEYFEEILKKITCAKPVIILKDIRHNDLSALLHYMYLGEASVPQSDLSRLIKAAECLQVKGLAVADDTGLLREKKKFFTDDDESILSVPHSSVKKRKQTHCNSIYMTSFERTCDVDIADLREVRRAIVQQEIPHVEGATHQVVLATTNPHAGFIQGHTTVSTNEQSHHLRSQLSSDIGRKSQEEVFVARIIPEVLVEECESVKQEIKDSVKEEASGRKNNVVASAASALNVPASDDDDDHSSGAGAGLHDLLTIPAAGGSQQEGLVAWDGASGGLTSYSLETLIPEDIRHQQHGSSATGTLTVTSSSVDCSSGVSSVCNTVTASSNSSTGSPVTIMGCPYCQRAFMYKSDLSRHVRTHTGERPYTCPHCPYRASQKSHLLEHVKRRHRPPQSIAAATTGTTSSATSTTTTVSAASLVVPSSITLVVPASTLVSPHLNSTENNSSNSSNNSSTSSNAENTVQHTVLQTPPHTNAILGVPNALDSVHISSTGSSNSILYTHPVSTPSITTISNNAVVSTSQLLYSPSNSPQHGVLHGTQGVTLTPMNSAVAHLHQSLLLSSELHSSSSNNPGNTPGLHLHLAPSSSGGGLTVGSTQTTSACSTLQHGTSLVLSPIHAHGHVSHHNASLPNHSTH